MCSDRVLKLEQKLIREKAFRVIGAAELAANQTEFAWPVAQHHRVATVVHARVTAPLGPVESGARKPSASELVVG
jgi:hypothetical protein